jgi:23S rRNA C2498 (ribose-2'-O)-methylase RlmM
MPKDKTPTEQAQDERRAHYKRVALSDYICAHLPDETRTDPVVGAVLNLHRHKEETTVEACLLDMVRELCKSKRDLMENAMRQALQGGDLLRIKVPYAPR